MSADSNTPSEPSTESEHHLLAGLEIEPRVTPRPGWLGEREHHSALAVAALAHLLLLAVLLRAPDKAILGDQGIEIEAIAVSIIASLPSHGSVSETTAVEPANASPPQPPPSEESDLAPKQEQKQEPKREKPAEIAVLPEPSPQAPAIVLPEEHPKIEEPKEKVEVEPAEDAKDRKVQASVATPPPQLAPSPSSAPVSAGTMQTYARQLAVALAKTKPRGAGFVGTVKLRFVVEPDGKPVSTTVIASSGRTRLDELAVAAISRNVFPPPPAGATEMQRTFVVPYAFR